MFSKLFKYHFINKINIKISLVSFLVVVTTLTIFYFSIPNNKTATFVMLALYLIVILGQWITFVIVPRSRARKHIDPKIIELKKEMNCKLDDKHFNENFLYTKGLTFILYSFPTMLAIILFFFL